MWDDLSLRNCDLSIEWTENQISFDGDISNGGNKWSMFKNRGMLFIHLYVNSFLQKIEKNAPSCGVNKCFCSRY